MRVLGTALVWSLGAHGQASLGITGRARSYDAKILRHLAHGPLHLEAMVGFEAQHVIASQDVGAIEVLPETAIALAAAAAPASLVREAPERRPRSHPEQQVREDDRHEPGRDAE